MKLIFTHFDILHDDLGGPYLNVPMNNYSGIYSFELIRYRKKLG
jgi:hypothetical protein